MTRKATRVDRYGFTLGTTSASAAAAYQEGVDLYMSGNAGGEAALPEAMSV